MYIGTSLFLIAVGAVLAFAITASAEGFNINTAGWILMGVGALGLLLSLMLNMRAEREVDAARRPPR